MVLWGEGIVGISFYVLYDKGVILFRGVEREVKFSKDMYLLLKFKIFDLNKNIELYIGFVIVILILR